VFEASVNKDLKAAVSLHGGGVTVEKSKDVVTPIFFACGSEDHNPKVELVEAIQKDMKGSGKVVEMKVYKGMNHGWALKGDESDENIRKMAKEAIDDSIEFITKQLSKL